MHHRNKLSNFAGPSRDRRSVFCDKRSDASVSRTLNITATGNLGGSGRATVTMVNSNTLANKLTCRTLGGTNESGRQLVIVLGSGRVSVSGGINSITECLTILHSGPNCFHLGTHARGVVGHVPLVNGGVSRRLFGSGAELGGLVCGDAFFRSLNFHCVKPVSKRGVARLYRTLRNTGVMGTPILLRVGAIGNGNCSFTRGSPDRFRKVSGFGVGANRPMCDNAGFSTRFNSFLYSVTSGSGHVYTVATTVSLNANLRGFEGRFPSEFCSINVTRRRTMAFSSKLTENNVIPIFTMCSAFLREYCSRLMRSKTVRRLRVVVTISHTNFINRSNVSRRNVLSTTFLGKVPNVAICSPSACARLGRTFVETVCRDGNIMTVHCPHNARGPMPRSGSLSFRPFTICNERSSSAFVIACNELCSCTYSTTSRLVDHKCGISILGLGYVGPVSRSTIGEILSYGGIFFFRRNVGTNNVNSMFSRVVARGNFGNGFGLATMSGRFMGRTTISTLLDRCSLSRGNVVGAVLRCSSNKGGSRT